MVWIASVFGVGVGTAIVPVFSLELYLVTVVLARPDIEWWTLGPAAAIGQLLGKSVHYLAARGAVRLPRLLKRPSPSESEGWGARWSNRFREQCGRHPVRSAALVLSSALAGLPPFGAIVVAAGLVRAPLSVLVPASTAGRVVRYCVLAMLPGLVGVGTWPW